MLSIILLIMIIVFLGLVGSFIPFGNENSTVRRLPWVTFSIMAVNTIVFFVTLPGVWAETDALQTTRSKVQEFVDEHQELLADKGVREKLIKAGLMQQDAADEIEKEVRQSDELESEYRLWLAGGEAEELREKLDGHLATYKNAREEHTWYRFGLAPNGDWKFYQLFTCAFLHGDVFHLFGNLLFFFAVAFSLEDLWGRGIFCGFYILGAAAACIPAVVSPGSVPMLGASGAISATMGAFLFRLPKTRIKLFCTQFFWLRLLLTRKTAVFLVPGYLYLASYFIAQLISWYFDSKWGVASGVAYSAHVAGFVYGVGFALLMKVTKTEENYINPKIEAKVSFSAAPAVNNALELLDQGESLSAERMLRGHLAKQPNDTNALLALIQVHQTTANFDQLNAAYARLIRIHLSAQDREAALYAYDSLLSAFPDDKVDPRVPPRDWLTICEYLRERQMTREAGVEYERLVKAFPDDALTGKAAVQGGEAALAANDVERALRLFRVAQEASSLPVALANRAEMGIERCEKIITHRPTWEKKPPKREEYGRQLEEEAE